MLLKQKKIVRNEKCLSSSFLKGYTCTRLASHIIIVKCYQESTKKNKAFQEEKKGTGYVNIHRYSQAGLLKGSKN